MNTAPETNRYAPPIAHVEDVAAATHEPAGRGTRLGAVLLDGLIQGAVYYALAFTAFAALLPNPRAGDVWGALLTQVGVGLLLFFAINGYLLVTQGQTVGKKLLGLRIVRSDGSRASAGRLIGLRYLLSWLLMFVPLIGAIYALLDSLMIFRESRKCLHDNLADTIVIKA